MLSIFKNSAPFSSIRSLFDAGLLAIPGS